MAKAARSLSPNLDLEYFQALRAAIDVVTRQLKAQGVKTSLVARNRLVELAREHLRQERQASARAGAAGEALVEIARSYAVSHSTISRLEA